MREGHLGIEGTEVILRLAAVAAPRRPDLAARLVGAADGIAEGWGTVAAWPGVLRVRARHLAGVEPDPTGRALVVERDYHDAFVAVLRAVQSWVR